MRSAVYRRHVTSVSLPVAVAGMKTAAKERRERKRKCLKDNRQKDEGEMIIVMKNEGMKCERRFRERASWGHRGSRRGVVIIIAPLLFLLWKDLCNI